MRETALGADDFVWLVGSLCHLNRIPFDPALLLQRFPAPHSGHQFIEACQALGFRIGAHTVGRNGLRDVRFPCVAFVKGKKPLPAIVVKADEERLLYFRSGSQSPETSLISGVGELLEPTLFLVHHETAQELAGDGTAPKSAFGFKWVWDELLKHKRIWRDVLLASLFIQLIALTTPLFTQVIIDKVVVHQTQSTLIVVAIGLAMCMVFSAGMTWLRQWPRAR